MAHIIRPAPIERENYRGLDWIFEYTNYDGRLQTFNCGQAALATFLTFHGRMDSLHAARNMEWLERHHPPDQFGGWFGTGRRRVERALRAFDLDPFEVNGADAIRRQLDLSNPVLLMVGLPSGKLWGFDLPGGHWMVAFGHEAERVHVTNWSPLTWDEIHTGWNSITSRWIRMCGRGIAVRVHS